MRRPNYLARVALLPKAISLGIVFFMVLAEPAAAQGSQSPEALKAEANMACAKARRYQSDGSDAYRRSQDPSASPEARAVAQQEVSALQPMYQQYKALCLQKKRDYAVVVGSTPSADTSPTPSGEKIYYLNGRFVCTPGLVCPHKSICLLGECSPGVERNRFWSCTGYGCKVHDNSCSCAATYLGSPCCTRLSYP